MGVGVKSGYCTVSEEKLETILAENQRNMPSALLNDYCYTRFGNSCHARFVAVRNS